jgi:hypothetical protein
MRGTPVLRNRPQARTPTKSSEEAAMTELVEAVHAAFAGGDQSKCPFDCGKNCTATNNFKRKEFKGDVRSGTRSACYKKMDDGSFATDSSKTDGKSEPADKQDFPNEWGWTAHHLIPVAVLRDHKLRKYLDKDAQGAQVSCNAGYEVNGAPNGVWLIASYSGMQTALKDPDVAEIVRYYMSRYAKSQGKKAPNASKSAYSVLASEARDPSSEDPLGFQRWLYATMAAYKRQFHDGNHPDYSRFVEGILTKVRVNMVKRKRECWSGGSCKDKSEKPRAPHRLAKRLDHISRRLESHLTGEPSRWKNPIFTSQFAKQFAIEIQAAAGS